MSPYFLCYDCSRATPCQQDDRICPSCTSSNGRILTDEEFRKQYSDGVIHLIDPSTGKPFKKGK
jgi:RNA polymerase subunit RPABC4/transcription elongation factor Spt4